MNPVNPVNPRTPNLILFAPPLSFVISSMNALHLVGVNVRTTKAPARAGITMERALDDHRACRREIHQLTAENARLSGELERLRTAHDDLRGSTEVWIHLYEAQLQRTRSLEQRRQEEDLKCEAPISRER